jgi:hypothetical protein
MIKTSKKLLSAMRGLIEENIPYKLLRHELEKEYFDPIHSARRFERSQNHHASSGVVLMGGNSVERTSMGGAGQESE